MVRDDLSIKEFVRCQKSTPSFVEQTTSGIPKSIKEKGGLGALQCLFPSAPLSISHFYGHNNWCALMIIHWSASGSSRYGLPRSTPLLSNTTTPCWGLGGGISGQSTLHCPNQSLLCTCPTKAIGSAND